MKKIFIFLSALFLGILLTSGLNAQNVAINNDGSDPHPSAMLDVQAENMGLLIPRITEANRPADPATGLLIYQTDGDAGFYYYNGTEWQMITNQSNLGTMASQDADDVLITGGSIDGVAIGALDASTGKFTTLEASGSTLLKGDLNVDSGSDVGYNFMVNANTGEVTAMGVVAGKELQTLSGNIRIAEDENDLPWINVLKNGNKVFEMGLGTDDVGQDAGYGLNINNDDGQTVAGMGYSHGEWVNGIVDPSTYTIAGASTDGAGSIMLQIKSLLTKDDLFKADNLGNVLLSNDLSVGNDANVTGNLTVGQEIADGPESYLTVNGVLRIPGGATNGYFLQSDNMGEASWSQISNTDINGLGTMATQNADDVLITGGSIDGVAIGALDASTGKFTTLEASGSTLLKGDLNVDSGSDVGYNFMVNANTGEVAAMGVVAGKELQTLSGNIRIAEDENDLPWINVLKNGNKVFEMGLGTDDVGQDAGYGLNINNDNGQTVAGMGYSHGEWVNGIVDPSTYTIAGASTDGAGSIMLQIKSMLTKDDLFKADNLGNVLLSNDLSVGNDATVTGTLTVGNALGKSMTAATINGDMLVTANTTVEGDFYLGSQTKMLGGGNAYIGNKLTAEDLEAYGSVTSTYLTVTNGATDGYFLKSDASGNGSWAQLSNTDINGLGTMATQDADNVAITGGNIDGTAIGATTPSTGKFSSFESTGTASVGDDLTVHAGTDIGYNFTVDAQTGDVTALGDIKGDEIQTLSGNLRIAEDGDALPWINVLKNGNKVFEMGLGTDGVGQDAGYGLNINNDNGQTVAGMGYSHGEWVNGIVDPSTYTIAGASTDGAGSIMLQIKSMLTKDDLFKADNLGNVLLSNDLTVGNDANVTGNLTVGQGITDGQESYLTVNGALRIPVGATDGYFLKSDNMGEASWSQISNSDINGLGTLATQDANNVSITGGTIDGTPIGTGVKGAAAGAFTTLGVGNDAYVNGNLYIGNMAKADNGNVVVGQKLTAEDVKVYGSVTSTTIHSTANTTVDGNLTVGQEVAKGKSGQLTVNGTLTVPQGAGDGKVLTSDANGNATWQEAGGGSSQQAYGYFYNPDKGLTMVGNKNFPLTNNGEMLNMTHTVESPGNETVTVLVAGTYMIDYSVRPYSYMDDSYQPVFDMGTIAIAVNDVVDQSTSMQIDSKVINLPADYGYNVICYPVTGRVILALEANDVVTLRHVYYGSNTLSMEMSGNLVELRLVKID